MKSNYRTVSRIVLGMFLAVMIAAWLVKEPQAHMILMILSKGIAAAYIILVVLYYAKPSLFNNKTKEQPH